MTEESHSEQERTRQAAEADRRTRIAECEREQERLRNDDKYTRIQDPQDRSTAIAADRRTKEEEFYWAHHGKQADGKSPLAGDRAGHVRRCEVEWNAMRAEEARLNGDSKSWSYKQDRRGEFQFETREGTNRRGEPSMEVTGRGTVHPREKTIDWRADTEIGKKVAKDHQSDLSAGQGDDAGHLIASRYGVDPAEPYNLQLQNWKMNRGQGWKNTEDGIAAHVNKSGEPVSIEAKTRIGNSKAAPDREQSRSIEARDGNGQILEVKTSTGKTRVSHDLIAGNFSTEKRREAQMADRHGRSDEQARQQAAQARQQEQAKAQKSPQRRQEGPSQERAQQQARRQSEERAQRQAQGRQPEQARQQKQAQQPRQRSAAPAEGRGQQQQRQQEAGQRAQQQRTAQERQAAQRQKQQQRQQQERARPAQRSQQPAEKKSQQQQQQRQQADQRGKQQAEGKAQQQQQQRQQQQPRQRSR
ncbi:MAG: hypothetical protein IT435_10000 [Phycisphaerales bacterium]|nr:hypothetical protein [Phycisphaerales bacterium]